MAHIVADRVRETSTTTGTGTYDLDGAVLGFQDFDAACATNDTIYYVASMGADWEVGTGTFTAGSPDTLARTTILASSNGGAAVNWGAGIKDITGTYPASALSSISSGTDSRLQNLALAASVGSNALTISLKGADGNDPSASNKVVIDFRSSTTSTGTPTAREITSATSLVISSGSTLGTVNSTAFSLWIVAFDDAGTIRLGAIQPKVGGATPTEVVSIDEGNGQNSSTAEGGAGGADTAGIFYTGTAVTNKPLRILGYMEWPNGLATAGTWSSGPSHIQIFGPGIKPPGSIVRQKQTSTTTTSSTTLNSYQDTALSTTYTPKRACNLIKISWVASLQVAAGANGGRLAMHRSTTLIGTSAQLYANDALAQISLSNPPFYDQPNSAGAVTYTLKIKSGGTGGTVTFVTIDGTGVAQMMIEEVQA